MVNLGPFVLQGRLAAGGMGEVWRGVYAPLHDAVPVAVKVLMGESARNERYLRYFRDEVRAMARLQHPAVVEILDHGIIDARAADESDSALTAGSPYLVMELAGGGTIEDLPHPGSWRRIRSLLSTVLDGLAHAHARGVIHRDLKPSNILVCTDDDPRPGLKLSDFGIAHVGDPESMGRSRARQGTPVFMASEQLLGRWREFGPWTDLYALGVLAYSFVYLRVPYPGGTPDQILASQQLGPPRVGDPQVPVPEGFDLWILRMLARDPGARFQRAADAAWAMHALGDASGAVVPAGGGRSFGPTIVNDADDDEFDAAGEPGDPVLRSLDVPPVPLSWRPLEVPPAPVELVGAGLGLHGIRRYALVGRERERDALWHALREVSRTGVPRLVMVHGSVGVGKSALVEWLCERAHEVGAAEVWSCVFAEEESAIRAIARMVGRTVGCAGLPWEETKTKLASWLYARGGREAVAGALADLVCGVGGLSGVPAQLGASVELLAAVAAERPVVLWLEDAPWGLAGLDLVRAVMRRDDPIPVLVLLTGRDDALVASGGATELDAMLDRLGGGRLPLSTLDTVAQTALVRGSLGLCDGLAAAVERRAGGNPMLAVQAVVDWAARGLLVATPEGFELAPGARADVPADLRQAWQTRLLSLLRGLPPAGIRCLELAAVLGMEVDEVDWQWVCDRPVGRDVAPVYSAARALIRGQVVDRLLGARLADATEDGWRWAHGLLREAVLDRAHGRLAEYHRTCADLLALRVENDPSLWARVGRHLQAAGQHARAVDPLQRGARLARDLRHQLALLGDWEQALVGADIPESDPRWGQLWVARADNYRSSGRSEEALREARRAVAAAQFHQWQLEERKALIAVAYAALEAGDPQVGGPVAAAARDMAVAAGDAKDHAKAVFCLGGAAFLQGDFDAARTRYRMAVELFRSAGARSSVGDVLRNLGQLELNAIAGGERSDDGLDRAREAFEGALRAYAGAEREHTGTALGRVGLAQAARLAGDLDEAEILLHRATEELRSFGSGYAVLPLVQLGLTRLDRGQVRDATRILESARQELVRQRWIPVALLCLAGLLACAADGPAGEWRRVVGWFTEAAGHRRSIDPFVYRTLRAAAEAARRAGKPDRVADVERITRRLASQARRLGDAGTGPA